MKKSEIYRKAAIAVMNDKLLNLTFDERWEILKKLMEDEALALFIEEEDGESA